MKTHWFPLIRPYFIKPLFLEGGLNFEHQPSIQWLLDAGSPKRWDRSVANRPSPNWQEKYHVYTTYSPCRNWVKHATYLPPFRGTISTTIDQ